MFIIYDLIFFVFTILYLPIFLLRRKMHREFPLRLGILPRNLKLDQPIWLHAVSVGETMAVRGLAGELRKIYPDKKFVISTVTPTGNKIARKISGEGDFVTYLPLDLSFIVRKVIDRVKPCLFIIAETEIWPNLISYLYGKNIPLFIVNGRISDNSFRGYFTIKFLLKPILNKITMFCVQSHLDAQRLMRLGILKDKIRITGNMKFDIQDYADLKRDYTDYRLKLRVAEQEKLLVAGSTHHGEEEIILRAYKELLSEFPNLKLLLAPRHPERAKDVERSVIKEGFDSLFISNLPPTTYHLPPRAVFILDTIGELLNFYALADIVFVGGSLIKRGGHNILEPAIFSKAILFGPHMFNFKDIAELFLRNQAGLLVQSKQELRDKIKDLLDNPSKIQKLGESARRLILENQGATQKNLECIRSYKI